MCWWPLFMHMIPWAFIFALDNAGSNMAARMAIMAMTTSSSISVKARTRFRNPGWRRQMRRSDWHFLNSIFIRGSKDRLAVQNDHDLAEESIMASLCHGKILNFCVPWYLRNSSPCRSRHPSPYPLPVREEGTSRPRFGDWKEIREFHVRGKSDSQPVLSLAQCHAIERADA